MPDGSIQIPNNWKPRAYQQRLWDFLGNGGKRAVAVWHRRAGKDEVCLHHTACAAMERVGVYWHMLPQADQARKAIWDAVNPNTGKRRIDEAFPKEIRETTRETDMFIRFVNGSTWQVVGSDNFNSLVGTPPIGIVLSEWALADPAAWAYLSPILRDNGGWALFIFTPRGRNHAHKTLLAARKTNTWFAETLTVDDTLRFSKEDLAEERQTLTDIYGEDDGENSFQQEYYCSFDAAVIGSYYGKLMADAEKDGRITSVQWDNAKSVNTAWDIGKSDKTAIWFFQQHGVQVQLIDYYQNVGQDIAHYAKVLHDKPYVYGEHIWPHDGARGDWSTAKTRPQIADDLKISPRILRQEFDVTDGIDVVRRLLPRCWFDAEKCALGLDAMRSYRKEWDAKNLVFKKTPLHDWASDPADAFRYLARGIQDPSNDNSKPRERYRRRDGGDTSWMSA